MSAETRYHALLKVCDLACAHATATGADRRSDFWATISVALADDCPEQSHAAARIAASLIAAEQARVDFLRLVNHEPPPTAAPAGFQP